MLLNQVEITLNCTESKWAAVSCTESQMTLNLWLHPRSVVPAKFGDQVWLVSEVTAIPQPKRPSPWVWLLVHVQIIHFSVLVFTCALTHLCVCFPLRAISEGQIGSNVEPNLSQRLWPEMCLFCFCKIKFSCKMHMQKFCTEVTILP